MKSLAALLAGVLPLALAAAPNAQLARIHSVYVLPMGNGLDQYLANRLTNLGVFRVVTDPQKADALLTDNLGEAFESRFEKLYPAAKPEAAKPEAAKPEAAKPEAEEPEAGKKPAPPEAAKGPDPGAAKGAAKDQAKPAAKPKAPGDEDEEAAPSSSFEVSSPVAVPVSTFHRAKGTVFLVDRQERDVVWSTYLKPKNSTSGELHRAAGRIAEELTREAQKLTKAAAKKP
jgi:hypothetical protein